MFSPSLIRAGLVLLALPAILSAKDLLPAQQVSVRGGLPNVAQKLEKKESLKLAFLGGSITYGGGKHGYVEQVTEWFREKYPDSPIKVVNAGVSGTDSNFGAKRLDRDLLVHDPDLLLVEFAVNDGDRDHTSHMERILHKAWKHNPEMDVVIFYTLAKNQLTHYDQGVLPPSAQAHERVAEFYQVPTIGLAHDVAAKLRNQEIVWKDFANDSCHPHRQGYGFFAETFRQTLPELLKAPQQVAHDTSKTLTKNLVVYPEPVEVKPLEVPTFVNAEGKEADVSFVLPKVGVNWAGDATFTNEEGKPLWRMHYLKDRRKQPFDATLATKKTDWSSNLGNWFEEDKSFVGASSYPVFLGRNQMLRYSDRESGVVAFIAPETGDYEFKVETQGIKFGQNDKKKLAFNVVKYKWGEPNGESLAYTDITAEQPFPESLEVKTHLVAGEDVVFALTSDTPNWSRGGLKEFTVTGGLYR